MNVNLTKQLVISKLESSKKATYFLIIYWCGKILYLVVLIEDYITIYLSVCYKWVNMTNVSELVTFILVT